MICFVFVNIVFAYSFLHLLESIHQYPGRKMLALSLVSMTTGQKLQKPSLDLVRTAPMPADPAPAADDFMGLDDELDENDLNVILMEEHSGEVAGYLKQLQKNFAKIPTASRAADDVPDELQEALKAGVDLFDSSSAINEDMSLAVAAKRIPYPPRTKPYHCPHNTHQLKWFPLVSGHTVTDYCFVPSFYWPVTYATCSTKTCSTNSWRTGRCLPSCYNRRRLRVVCININGTKPWISWRTITRNLPQSCRCGTC